MRTLIGALLVVASVFTSSFAEEVKFATTSKEIVEGLTEKSSSPRQFRTRGIKFSDGSSATGVVINKSTPAAEKTIKSKNGTGQKETKKINLKIMFDVNSSSIRIESFHLLAELGKALSSQALKNKIIIINGHTDSDGDEEYNLKLSHKRANAVKKYLVSNFQITSALETRGWGESSPLVANDSAQNKQINRRVEIVAQDKMH